MGVIRKLFIFSIFFVVVLMFCNTAFALVSSETQITTNAAYQSDPEIYGDKVVWTDWGYDSGDIYEGSFNQH